MDPGAREDADLGSGAHSLHSSHHSNPSGSAGGGRETWPENAAPGDLQGVQGWREGTCSSAQPSTTAQRPASHHGHPLCPAPGTEGKGEGAPHKSWAWTMHSAVPKHSRGSAGHIPHPLLGLFPEQRMPKRTQCISVRLEFNNLLHQAAPRISQSQTELGCSHPVWPGACP